MRIQHNIMAMNAYRNYTNNVSAMKANLEKLSSGYKINRAGDDAAGLAISEKMRAQITGLQTAQKNAKDGISLVQTAEGALTEVHDMLNRMVELASMSANGTYDNTTDRAQLQKEVDQLRDEINRIADSSNFNGIKLLDGSMSSDANKISGDSRIISQVYTTGNAAAQAGTKTFLDGEVDTESVPTVFDVDFNGLTAKPGGADPTAAVYTQDITLGTGGLQVDDTITIAGKTLKVVAGNATTVADDEIKLTDVANADVVAAKLTAAGIADAAGTDYTTTVSGTGNKLTFTCTAKTAGEIGESGPDAAATALTATYSRTPTTAAVVGTQANPTPGAEPETDVSFTFTIGDKQVTATVAAVDSTDETTSDATAIAAAVLTALGGDGSAVTINGVNYTVSDSSTDGKLTFTLKDTPTDENIAANVDWDVKGNGLDSFDGNHTAGVTVTTAGSAYKDAPKANTVFRLEDADIKDGTKITIDGTTVTLAVGKKSQNMSAQNAVDLRFMEEGSVDLDVAISKISAKFAGTVSGASGTEWTVGVNDTSVDDTHKGLTVHKANDVGTYDTKAKLAAIFEIEKPAGGGLRLQIGDTADTYNQLNVSIKDMHAASLGLSGIDISTQEGAAEAIDAIKAAINTVSDVRGTLGATQNRLDHTINNLSVMTENIQDAESTIRDVDVAEEMMAYTKNNILIQSAQAMLAQANQVPQGVLQLLQ